MKNESFKELLEDDFIKVLLIVKHTTSKKCLENEVSDEVDPEGETRPLKISFGSRSLANKVLFSVYKLLRIFYLSIIFYFLPMLSVVVSGVLPIKFQDHHIIPANVTLV